jgi:hypothetical protein
MNPIAARFILLFLFWGTAELHAKVMISLHLPPTDGAGVFFFCTAATVDWLLLYSAPRLISGRLCDDIQALCIACVIVNAAGLCGYLAYTPPALYYIAIKGITYVQYLRLLYVGRHDADYIERAVVPGTACVGA